MLVAIHLLPRYNESRAVSAEYRVRCVFKIALGIVAELRYYFFLIVSGKISVGGAEKSAFSASIGDYFLGVVVKRRNGRSAYDSRKFICL
jgi:hypothetical protein